MSVLEVRHLEMIRAICSTGSVARAAEQVHLSQPALSHALRALEDRLGTRLFDRAGRMAPTPAGRVIAEAAAQVLPLVEAAERAVARQRQGQAGTVRVATECFTCYHWLPSVLQALRRERPAVSVELVPGAGHDPARALLDGTIDLAVVHTVPRHRRLASDRLFADEMVLVMPADHSLATRRHVDPEDFADQTLLCHATLEDSTLWREFLDVAGVRPAHVANLRLTEAVIASIKAGLGVGVLARWVVAPALTSGDLVTVRLGRRGLRRTWYATTRRAARTADVAALLALLRAESGRLVRAR